MIGTTILNCFNFHTRIPSTRRVISVTFAMLTNSNASKLAKISKSFHLLSSLDFVLLNQGYDRIKIIPMATPMMKFTSDAIKDAAEATNNVSPLALLKEYVAAIRIARVKAESNTATMSMAYKGRAIDASPAEIEIAIKFLNP